jgi:hypothetical protein
LKKKATRSRKPGNKSPNTSGLAAPWRPGQSGNPRGSSKKQRRKKLLKEALRDAINIPIPEAWRGKLAEAELDGRLGVAIEKDMTIGDLISAHIIVAALQGDHVAIDQILGSEPKVVDVGLPPGTAVDVPTEAKRLKEVTEILREIGVVK